MNKLALVALLGTCGPVLAAECRTISLPAAIAETEANGGALVDMIDVPGIEFDQIVVVNGFGMLWIGYAKEGCMVSRPIPIGKAVEATPA